MTKLSIGIDATSLLCRQPRGEGRTIFRLYREIARLRANWTFLLYTNTDSANTQEVLRDIPRSRAIVFDPPGHRWSTWENVGLPLRAWRDRVDVLHCPSSGAPLFSLTPIVVTVHDLIPLLGADGQDAAAAARFKRQLTAGLRRARTIVTGSQHTRTDILKAFPQTPAERIRVITWGADPALQGAGATAPRGGAAFFLAIGGTAPRKNTEGLLIAFALAHDKIPSIRLKIVGLNDDRAAAKMRETAAALGIGERVDVSGFIADEALDGLYREALSFIYPSRYEGFGLPLLEAMSRGTPVIASNASSIPEVTGDAAILVDPEDRQALADAMVRIGSDATLRGRLAVAGALQAQRFDWTATAEATAAILEQAAGVRATSSPDA